MTAATGQDSNLSSVRYAVESTIGVLPGSPVWNLMEPNSEPEFGVKLETVERDPIRSDRMSLKGSIVDRVAGVQIEQDFIVDNQPELMQGFMFAPLGIKAESTAITGVTAVDDTFAAASGLDAFAANDLVFASGFTNPANNGLHLVSSATATTLVVGTALVDETPPTGHKIVKVGHQYATADVTVDASGARPKLVTAAGDFQDLGVVVGEEIYIGGDAAAFQFADAANNGGKRVYLVSETELTVDKSYLDMVTDAAGTGKTIRIFTGHGLKNLDAASASFLVQYLQFERTLGAPDDAQPTQIQSQYVTGNISSECDVVFPAQGKVTSSMTWMGQNGENRSGATGVKSGDRPDLVPSDAINTSSDIRRILISQVNEADEAPTALFALVESMNISINNNIQRNTALGVVGAARFTIGKMQVSGQFDAYFADIAALDALDEFVDVTMNGFIATASNQGLAWDMPLVSLRSDGASVSQDAPIKLLCDYTAHNGAKVDPTLNHLLCWTFFPYLPTLAQTQP